jgi:hypothetical protein
LPCTVIVLPLLLPLLLLLLLIPLLLVLVSLPLLQFLLVPITITNATTIFATSILLLLFYYCYFTTTILLLLFYYYYFTTFISLFLFYNHYFTTAISPLLFHYFYFIATTFTIACTNLLVVVITIVVNKPPADTVRLGKGKFYKRIYVTFFFWLRNRFPSENAFGSPKRTVSKCKFDGRHWSIMQSNALHDRVFHL